jgi:hypothetical protein
VLFRAAYHDPHLSVLFARAALIACEGERSRARYWRDTAARLACPRRSPAHLGHGGCLVQLGGAREQRPATARRERVGRPLR